MPLDPTTATPTTAPYTLRRKSLCDRLDGAQHKRVVLVVGQAAQGKSTLVTDYLSTQAAPSAWLHLDETDADPVNFCFQLVRALSGLSDTVTADVHLAAHPVTLGPQAGLRRHEDRIRKLMSVLAVPYNLVIDGLECLPPGCGALALIDGILTHLPRGATCYLLSRSQPALRLSRFMVRQDLVRITNADLAFTPDEIDAFFRRRGHARLSPALRKQLHQLTEGWVGGLVLVAGLMDQSGPTVSTRWVEEVLPKAFQKEAWAFFAEEIFRTLPEADQRWLSIAALPATVRTGLLQGLGDAAAAEAVLRDLVRRNLFIQADFEPGGGDRYRFHQLFREFLSSRFYRTTRPQRQREIFAILADNLEREGRAEEAIGFRHRAGQHQRVADAIVKIGTDLVVRGRIRDLKRYLDHVPEVPPDSDPRIAFYRVLCRRLETGPGDAQAFDPVYRAFVDAKDAKGMLLAMAYRIESAVFAGLPAHTVMAWITDAEALLEALHGQRLYTYARTLLWMQMGFGAIVSGGQTRRGIAACAQARRLAGRIRDAALESNAAVIGAFGHLTAGDFDQAATWLAEAAPHIDGATYPEYRVLQRILDLELMLIAGRFADADAQVAEIQAEIDTHDLLFIYPLFIEQVGRLRISQGAFTAAAEQVRYLADIVALGANPFIEALLSRLEGALHYHSGRYAEAARHLADAASRFTAHAPDSQHTLVTQALVDIVARHVAPAPSGPRRGLEAACDGLARRGRSPYAAELHLALALAAGTPAAETHLAAAFAQLPETGPHVFLLLNRDDLFDACRLAMSAAPETAGMAAAMMHRIAPSRPAPVSDRVDGAALPDGPELWIRTFGEFTVARKGEAAVSAAQWGGKKPRRLLKAIVVHGVRDVPREVLVEDLWPESAPEAGVKRFKVTLHRLRKVLEPDLAPGRRSRYIHLHNNRISLDSDLCRVDVEGFLDALKRFTRNRRSGDTAAMMAAGHAATEIYQGVFLPDERYNPWVVIKRNALQDHCIEMRQVLGEHYRRQGDDAAAVTQYRAIVQTDPGLEDAQRTLMSLYLKLGRRKDAIRTYEDYRKFAESFLGISPDTAISALYRRITGKP